MPLAGYASDPCMVTFATSPSIGVARHPSWGPNKFLAFERGTLIDGVPQSTSIAIIEGPGHDACDITKGPAQDHNPNWAPEGFQPPN